jgi:hypothetical protein
MPRQGIVTCTEEFLASESSQSLFGVFRVKTTKELGNGITEFTGTSPLFDEVPDDVFPRYAAKIDSRNGIQLINTQL